MNRKIFVQCATGGRATLAAKQLKDIGFTNVTAVVMTLTDWENKEYPIVKDQTYSCAMRQAVVGNQSGQSVPVM